MNVIKSFKYLICLNESIQFYKWWATYKLHTFHLHDNFNAFLKNNAMKRMHYVHIFLSYLNL